jgi:apolipoprotein D and lipocalin family protein
MAPNFTFWNFVYGIYSRILNFFYCKSSLQALNYVDLSKYIGLWYEVARSINPFELATNSATAEYSLQNDAQGVKYIGVKNVSYNSDGTVYDVAEGQAYISNPSTSQSPTTGNSQLYVNFTSSIKSLISPFEGQYWILEFNSDPINGYAIVGESTRTYFWILSRNKVMDSHLLSLLLMKIKNQYLYNISNIVVHNT